MKITIDTESRTVQMDNERVHSYDLGSVMATAVRVVEKLLKLHTKPNGIMDRTR